MKKLSLLFAVVILFVSVFSVSASAATEEEPDLPCGGVVEKIDVSVIYIPFKGRFLFGNTTSEITGTVLKVTYPDGSSEILTVGKEGNEYSAGKFSVSVFEKSETNIGKIENYGFLRKSINVSRGIENFVGYDGDTEFVCLHIPSCEEFMYLVDTYLRIIF